MRIVYRGRPYKLTYYERVNYKIKKLFTMDCHNYCFLQPRYLLYTVTKKKYDDYDYDRCLDVFKNSNSYFICLYYHAKVQFFAERENECGSEVFTGKRMPQIPFCDVICGSEEGGNPRTP